MANNYCESSSFLNLTKQQIEQARPIIDRVVKELEAEENESCGVMVDVEDEGIWFHYDEYFNPEHAFVIIQALLDELKIDEPFTFSWAYTCSKQRVDEFGGGACSLKRGYEPFWVDAMELAVTHVFKKKRGSK